MPPLILSGAAARVRATAPTNSVRRRHVSKSTIGKHHDAPTRRAAWVCAWPAFPARNVPGGVNAGWRRGDATRARVIDPQRGRGALTAEGEGDDDDQRRDDEDDAPGKETLSAADVQRVLASATVTDTLTDTSTDTANGTANDDADDEDGEDDPWFEHLPYILEFSSPIDAVAILDSIDEDMQLAAAAETTAACLEETDADRSSAASDPAASASPSKKAPGEVDEFIGYGALFASIANLGLPALVNSCIEPMISSAETACAGKIGVLYLAALAPSSSLFAFAAEMCFAMSIVVTNTIAKVAAGESRAGGSEEEEEEAAKQRNTITAAVAASFVSGAVLACALAALAGPLLSLMHVPPEVAPIVRTYVAVRALGLPFFAASNAAEGVFIGQRDGVTPMVAWTATGAVTLGVIVAAAHPDALGLGLPGSAAAVSLGQALTAAWFFRGLAKNGWLAWPKGDGEGGVGEVGTSDAGGSSLGAAAGAPRSDAGRRAAAAALACRALWSRSVDVLVESRMLNEIGWMFLGAFSRMGTYAAITASASALGVVPGATHKVALETFWILSFLTEPVFTACNALIPRELHAGRWGSARKLRAALIALSVLLGSLLSCAAFLMTRTAVYSDDPAVTAALSALTAPLAVALALSAVAYGVEGTIIGCGEVGYLGRTHARDFLLVLLLLKAHSTFPSVAGSGLAGIWWVLAFFQGLRICQHWCHLAMTRPFWEKEADLTTEEAAEADGKALLIA